MEHGFSLPACILGFLLHAYIEKFTILTSYILDFYCFITALTLLLFFKHFQEGMKHIVAEFYLSILLRWSKNQATCLKFLFTYVLLGGWPLIYLMPSLLMRDFISIISYIRMHHWYYFLLILRIVLLGIWNFVHLCMCSSVGRASISPACRELNVYTEIWSSVL